MPWFKDVDPNTFYPRCYNLGDADEKTAFFGNVKLLNSHYGLVCIMFEGFDIVSFQY